MTTIQGCDVTDTQSHWLQLLAAQYFVMGPRSLLSAFLAAASVCAAGHHADLVSPTAAYVKAQCLGERDDRHIAPTAAPTATTTAATNTHDVPEWAHLVPRDQMCDHIEMLWAGRYCDRGPGRRDMRSWQDLCRPDPADPDSAGREPQRQWGECPRGTECWDEFWTAPDDALAFNHIVCVDERWFKDADAYGDEDKFAFLDRFVLDGHLQSLRSDGPLGTEPRGAASGRLVSQAGPS